LWRKLFGSEKFALHSKTSKMAVVWEVQLF